MRWTSPTPASTSMSRTSNSGRDPTAPSPVCTAPRLPAYSTSQPGDDPARQFSCANQRYPWLQFFLNNSIMETIAALIKVSQTENNLTKLGLRAGLIVPFLESADECRYCLSL